MQFTLTDLPRLLPEILLLVLALLVLLSDVLERWGTDAKATVERHRAAWQLAAAGLLLTFGLVVIQSRLFFTMPDPLPPGGLNTALNWLIGVGRNLQAAVPTDAPPVLGAFSTDTLTMIARLALVTVALIVVLLGADYLPRDQPGEVYSLILFATAGMCLLCGASELILLFIALELTSIALYVLIGYTRAGGRPAEAGLKYFLFGAVSSGLLLYGMSLAFGLTLAQNLAERGATTFAAIGAAVEQTGQARLLLLAVLLIIAGLGYKLGAAPFHSWAPDVYQGAPPVIAGFLATASKIAGFVVLFRLLTAVFPGAAGTVAGGLDGWIGAVLVAALVSLLIGNLAALPQSSARRLLAYSSIAQAGFMLLALLAWGGGAAADQRFAATTLLYYLITYSFANLAAFGVLAALGADDLQDLRGLWQRSPALTLALTLPVLSLAGIPPLAGFWGKLFVFMAAVRSGAVWLAAIGVALTVVGLAYYLRVLRAAWFPLATDDPAPTSAFAIGRNAGLGLALCTLLVVLLGVLPGPLWSVLERVASR